MNVLVSWIREDRPVTAILDFIELAKSHSGKNMAEALVNTLDRYGIAHKVSFRQSEHKKAYMRSRRVLLRLTMQQIMIL
jgi:hypothetical protein